MKACACALPTIAVLLAANAADAPSVAGKWKAEFDTPIGVMKYVYEFKVDGEKLTGKAVRDFDGKKTDVEIAEGKVKGNTLSFVEPFVYMDTEIKLEYTGKLKGDEIAFTRKDGSFATFEVVAKRLATAPAKKAADANGKVIPVWPSVAPGSEGWKQKEVEYRNEWDRKAMVRNVTMPTLTAFLPDPAVATGAAAVICPGGGFRFLSWQSEGTEVAEWLRARGVAAFVLKYRLLETAASEEEFRKQMAAFFASLADRKDGEAPKDLGKPGEVGPRAIPEDMRKVGALAVADGRQAIKVVRQHAAEWGIKPDRIGVMGFSAGGMVTMGVVMDHDADSRPDFAAPIYGGGTGAGKVAKDAPPLFILCASDDQLAAAGSVRLYSEWKAAGRPAELHLYEKGGHGFGMTPKGLPVDRWIERYGDWLGQRGLIRSAAPRPQTSPPGSSGVLPAEGGSKGSR
jgi:acetyl esterase/lipase